MDEGLQHRLQVSRRQIVPLGKSFGCDRCAARMQRDIDDGGDGKQAFFGETGHNANTLSLALCSQALLFQAFSRDDCTPAVSQNAAIWLDIRPKRVPVPTMIAS